MSKSFSKRRRPTSLALARSNSRTGHTRWAVNDNRTRFAIAAADYEQSVTTFGFDSGEAMAAWLRLKSQPCANRPMAGWQRIRP